MKRLLTAVLLAACAWTQAASLDVLGAPDTVKHGAKVWKDLKYGDRPDAPGEGAEHPSAKNRRDATGHLFNTHRTGQFYDVFAPADGIRRDTPVFVYLHGGAWSAASDKDGGSPWFLAQLTRRGFLVVNLDYQLQSDQSHGRRDAQPRANATCGDMARDIDTAVTHLKRDLLPRLGIETDRVAIGGSSAGGHLALLYAFDQDNPSVMDAGLRHDLRVGFVVSIVGPSDFTNADFLKPLVTGRMGLGSVYSSEAVPRLARLVGWLVGRDIKADFEQGRKEAALAALKRYSPLHQVTAKSAPAILSYCQIAPLIDTDGCVPVSMYTDLKAKLDARAVHHEARLWGFSKHGLKPEHARWVLDNCARFAERYLK